MCACVHVLLCVCGGDGGEERWIGWWMILSERPLLIVRTFFLWWDKWQQSSERRSRKDKMYKPQYRDQLSPQWPEVHKQWREHSISTENLKRTIELWNFSLCENCDIWREVPNLMRKTLLFYFPLNWTGSNGGKTKCFQGAKGVHQ